MKQCLQVDHHRVLAKGDQVLVVDVGREQDVQERERGALAAIEAIRGRGVLARPGRQMFDPTVVTAIEHPHDAKRRHADQLAARDRVIASPQELLEVGVWGQGFGLVHEVRLAFGGLERQLPNSPPTAVRIGERCPESDQAPRRGKAPGREIAAVGRQPLDELEQLSAELIPDRVDRLTEDDVLLEQRGPAGEIPEPGQETGEPRLGGLVRQLAEHAGAVELENQRAQAHPAQDLALLRHGTARQRRPVDIQKLHRTALADERPVVRGEDVEGGVPRRHATAARRYLRRRTSRDCG